MLKSLFYSIMIVGGIYSGLTHNACAEAPMAGKQVPGYYRMQRGKFEITALYDGSINLDKSLLQNISSDKLNRLLARYFVGNPKMATAVNAYLINTGNRLVLVDTGAGRHPGSPLGHIAENIRASGYSPSQVDTILITHMHGDHIGGLNDINGKPVYPNANIYVAKLESDYWLSEKNARNAPASKKRFFAMARYIATRYIAAGKWKTFIPGKELIPGIRSLEAKGHTPGHTAYVIESNKKKLVIWGDIVHAYAVQFTRPGVAIDFDSDPNQAVITRRKLLKAVAADKSLVAGMHLPFPGIGRAQPDGQGQYTWIPVEFKSLPESSTPLRKKSY